MMSYIFWKNRLLKSMLQSMKFLLVLVCAPLFSVFETSTAANAVDVYVVDTVDRRATRIFGEALARACASCGTIKYRQMNGNLRAARRIAHELLEEEEAGRLSLVVTLGRPATRVIVNHLKKTPILYTFVGRRIDAYEDSPRVFGLPTDAPLEVQLDLLQRLQPDIKSAGIVISQGNKGLVTRSDSIGAIGLNIYHIENSRELPDALRTAVQMNDALILLRDRMVVNNDSIKFLLQHTLENGRHTVAYSRSLVDMGLAVALVPKPEAFGRLLGGSAEAYLQGGQPANVQTSEAHYRVHTNPKVIEQLKQRTRPLAQAALDVRQ